MFKLKQKLKKLVPGFNEGHQSYSWWVLASVMFGTFMAVIDATIVNVGLPKMMSVFGTGIDKVEWVLTAYLLAFAVMLPSSGWIADHFGYKRTYFLGMLLFTLGSLLCSLSWNIEILIFFRVLQGIGGGLLMPIGMAIITREFPPEKRGVALGFWGVAAAASISVGPMLGGYLIDSFSWHMIFDINVPIGIFGLFSVYVVQREFNSDQKKPFDTVGFISMSVFLTFLLLALADGNASWNTEGWTSDFILSCFFISFIALVVFLTAEFTVKNPMLELRLLKERNFGISTLMLFVFGMALFGNSFLLPLYLQNSLGYTALQAGLVFFPVGIIQAIVSPAAGYLSDKINKKIPIFCGIVLLGLSLFLFHFFSLTTEHSQIMLPLYIRGVGIGLLFSPLSALALMDIPGPKMAQASSMFNTIRQVGGSFGVALLGTILTQRIAFHSSVYSAAVEQNSPQFKHILYGLTSFVQNAAGGAGKEVLLKAKAIIAQNLSEQAFIQGINDDFLIGSIITFSLIFMMFFLKTKKESNSKKIELID